MRHRHLLARLLLAGALIATGSLPGRTPRAEARGEPANIVAVRVDLRAKLHAVADYCTSAKLFGARYDVYELILSIWPDDATARKSNGYAREDASWSPSGRKRPHNLKAAGIPSLRAMQTEVALWYMGRIADAVSGMAPGDAAAWKGRALDEAVRLAPADEALRARNGEVRGRGPDRKRGWLLVETVRSRKRRPALAKRAAKALKAVPRPKRVEPRARDQHSTVTWKVSLATGRGRILGLPDAKEAAQTLVNAEATFPVFEEAFGIASPGPAHYTVYDFDMISKGNVFMAGRPGVSESWLKFVTPLIACWMPKTDAVIVKAPRPETRLEAAPRQVMSAQIGAAFGIRSKQGWAAEGFALYLVWNITGTRLINAVRQSKYGEKKEQVDLAKRMHADDTDWVAEARTLVEGRFAPDLRLLLGKTVNTLTPEDVLYSYVFAMYLIEGHREALPGFLRDLAKVKGAGYDGVFGAHLGRDVASTQARVKRWLRETADLK